MKKLWNAARNRLKGSKGESLAEVLVALLISAVALVMLASMISAATRMIKNSKTNIETYYQNNELLTLHTEDTQSKTGSISLKVTGETTSFYTTPVHYRENTLGKTTVIAYWK